MDNKHFHINHYSSLDAGSFVATQIMSFKDLVDYLDVKTVHSNKYHNGLYTIGEVKDGYRINDNIINKEALCIDFDDLEDGVGLVEMIKKLPISYVCYSTNGHTQDNYRLRLVIPLSEPIEPSQYKYAIQIMADGLGAKCDDKSWTLSQAMARQVLKSQDSNRIFFYQDTRILETKSLLPAINERLKKDGGFTLTSQYTKRDDSYWDSIAYGRLSEGGRNNALASLTGHLMKKNVNINVIIGLLSIWNDTLEPPLSYKEFEKTVQSIIRTELKRRGGG